jgi:hypothetical protein
LRGADEPASARLANLERALSAARAEIEAVRVARDAALKVAAWGGGRTSEWRTGGGSELTAPARAAAGLYLQAS